MKVGIIGGGAAGFFAAISAKCHHPDAAVELIEKSDKLLAKVRISGGGRCNVTHDCLNIRALSEHYPRGQAFLHKAFQQWSVSDTKSWFESHGVKLKTEADGRMFPVSNQSESVVAALLETAIAAGVSIRTHTVVHQLIVKQGGFELKLDQGVETFDKVIVCVGGQPKLESFSWLAELGVPIVSPVPSLFTFNMPDEPVRTLMGVSVPNASVKWTNPADGRSIRAEGPLLITHWGMSGPAVLRCSAFGARMMHECHYAFQIQVNWLNKKEHELRLDLEREGLLNEMKKVGNRNPWQLPARLWLYLLERAAVNADKPWKEIGKKPLNKLINVLVNDEYDVRGKTTFKEEFVTAGGVDLEAVDPHTMQSKQVPGLYFAGEVLDIDGVTGGFNFQAAWTTGFIAGKLKNS